MSLSKYTIKISQGKIIGLIIVASFVGYLAYNSHDIRNNPDYEGSSDHTAPKEYWNLFPDTIRRMLKDPVTLYGKFHDPITTFNYSNRKYFVDVFKIRLKADVPLDKTLIMSNINNLQIFNGVSYAMSGGAGLQINYRPRKVEASHLNLSMFGGPISTIANNDTIACFYSDFKVFSVTCDRVDTSAIWSNADRKFSNTSESSWPIEVLFIKKDRAIYFLAMSVNERKTKLEPGQLYRLISPK